jgi:hypothetical protein
MRGRGNDANQPTPRVLFNDGPRGGSEGAGRLEEQVKKATATTETTTRRPGAQAFYFPARPLHDANVPHVRCVHGEAYRPGPTPPRRQKHVEMDGIHRNKSIMWRPSKSCMEKRN